MVKLLHCQHPDFQKDLNALIVQSTQTAPHITKTVCDILDDIRHRGDEALFALTKKFDEFEADATSICIVEEEINEAEQQCSPAVLHALKHAAQRIESYHKAQLPNNLYYQDNIHVTLGNIWRPIQSIGIYVPGGLASYPSSVLMNAIPARVAGVKEIIMTVPAPKGKLNPTILAAAKLCGIHRVFRIGGAQAIAALAYGTASIPKVNKIVGPGNSYVATAKQQLYGQVGIDMVAGPSEILVVSDNKTPVAWIAADLLSQAEHDSSARSILVTDDEDFAQRVITEIQQRLQGLNRCDIARKSWHEQGCVIILDSLKKAPDIINAIGPEHLELAVDNPEDMLSDIHNAGAIFLGRYTPEAVGDYIAGPSHVLPTGGSTAFSSGLSVFDFLKRISVIGCHEQAFKTLASDTILLAQTEGLDAHALSVQIRQSHKEPH